MAQSRKELSAEEVQRRKQLLESLCEGYRALRADPAAWAAEQAEREFWENASLTDLAEALKREEEEAKTAGT